MAGATVTATFEAASVRRALLGLELLGRDTAPLMRAIGAGLVETTQRRFETATDPSGAAWPGWSRAYAAVTDSRSLLRGKSGASGLMASITFAADARSVRVGTNKVYGAIHQFGGTIRPKKAKRLVFRLGKRLVFARKVTIPARPYLGFGPADRQVTHEVVHAALRAALAARRTG